MSKRREKHVVMIVTIEKETLPAQNTRRKNFKRTSSGDDVNRETSARSYEGSKREKAQAEDVGELTYANTVNVHTRVGTFGELGHVCDDVEPHILMHCS